MRSVRWLGLWGCIALGLLACEQQIESPTPQATALDPALACGEQLTTPIRVDGDNLSPLPFDVLADDPELALPDLWVQRQTDLAGEPVGDALVDLDESEAAGVVRWLSRREMGFDVFPELELTPGLYTFFARNADGQIAELPGAITIVPRPTLASIVPNIVCGEQIDNSFTLTGEMFITVDGRVPTVTIGGEDLVPSEVTGCVGLPGPAGAQACTTLVATLPAGTLEPAIVDVTVTNPEPAGCESTDAVQVEIVPPPSVSAIAPPLACLEQSDRTFVVSGSDFLVLEQDGADVFPTVSVGEVDVTPDAVDGCSALLGPAPGRRCTDLTITLPAASLDPGLQAVFVTNPEPAQCISEEEVDLEVVPPPTLVSIEPALVCSEQLVNTLTLTGSGFIVVTTDDGDLLPDVTFDGGDGGDALTLTADSADDCVPLLGTQPGRTCETLTVTLNPDSLAAGIYDMMVTNPPPAGCTSTEAVRFEVIPPPTLVSIEPALACLTQGDRGFELTGTNFLVLEGDADTFPDVDVGVATASVSASSGCTALEGPVAGRLCTGLTISLASGSLDPGLHDVVVTNPAPADCATQQTIQLETIAPPTLTAVDPILACVEGVERELALTGAGFLVLDADGGDLLPTVTVSNEGASVDVLATADNADCQPLSGTVAGRLCTGLTVSLPDGALEPGLFDVAVTNPPPAGCTSTEAVELEVVPSATVSSVDPQLVCGDQFSNTFTITGTDFFVFDDGAGGDLVPTVVLGDYSAAVDAIDGCTERTDSTFGGQTCTELTFTLPADGTAAGVHTAVVVNPAPADCASTEPVEVQVLGEPAVESLIPAGLCSEFADTIVRVQGTGFLSVGETAADWPTVAFGAQSVDVVGLDGCVALEGPVAGELCTGLDLFMESAVFTAFNEAVVVTNPPVAACVSDAGSAPGLEEVPPPTITGFEPDPVCDDATTFAILGTDFQLGATVAIENSSTGAPVPIDAAEIVLGDPDPADRIDITVPEPLTAGLYDVTVANPDTCFDTVEAFLEVVTGPFLFNIDPPVAFNQIRTLVTLYVAGVTGEIAEVWIVEDATGLRTDLAFNFDPVANANLVFAELPADTFPEGSYTVFIDDETDCPDFLEGVLFIEADETVGVGDIDPSFGWREANTAVDIFTLDPFPGDKVRFQDVPRVYLNPTADDSAVATLLRSVTFGDVDRLTAVVPAGLPAGPYEVVVVNPDGSLGRAPEPFYVTDTDSPPPVIDDISPVRVGASSDLPLTISGLFFRDDATVNYECQPPGGGETFDVPAPAAGFAVTPTAITAVMPAALEGLSEGTICVVQVTQTATAGEGVVIDTLVEFSAVSVISPSGNLFTLGNGASLETARRSPAVTSGRATNVNRFIYAIGGDDPDPVGGGGPAFHGSIEVAALDRFGNLEGWETLPDEMRLLPSGPGAGLGPAPIARTGAGVARIGRFIYLAGGRDADGPVSTVLRTQVLDPLAAPVPETAVLQLGDEDCNPVDENCGLEPGTYIYRVAALFANDDLVNPGGESLASDPFVVRVPDLNDEDDDDPTPNQLNRVQLTISWDDVPRALGYRVYRSPAPGAASGTEEFQTDVGEASIFDDGRATAPDPERVPLRLGALGEWAVVASLPGTDGADAVRDAPCVTWGVDSDDPSFAYVYVGGGLDGNGNARDTITVVPVVLESDDVQTVLSPFSSDAALGNERYECGGFAVGPWMTFGSGRIQNGSTASSTQTGRIVGSGECFALADACVEACDGDVGCLDQCDADLLVCEDTFPPGELVCGDDISALGGPCLLDVASRANAGYGVASTGSFLFMFGGERSSGDLDERIFEAEVLGPPDLGSWTPSGSIDLVAPRRYAGTAQESGFIFIIGGEIDTGPAVDVTATTRFTL